jgi:hypothetical protein
MGFLKQALEKATELKDKAVETAAPVIASAQTKAATVVATVQETNAGLNEAAAIISEQSGGEVTEKQAKNALVKGLAKQAGQQAKAAITAKLRR